MSRLMITLALLLSLATGAAARTIEELERGVELTLPNVKLPTATSGTVSFKTCGDCAYRTHRTMDVTVYAANGRALPLPEFLRVVEEIYERPGTAENDAVVAVFLDIASERVTRVTLSY
jgi:hypothetical protein